MLNGKRGQESECRSYTIEPTQVALSQLSWLRDMWLDAQSRLYRISRDVGEAKLFEVEEWESIPEIAELLGYWLGQGIGIRWQRELLAEFKRWRRGRGSVWPRVTPSLGRIEGRLLWVSLGDVGQWSFRLGEWIPGSGYGLPGELREVSPGLWRLVLWRVDHEKYGRSEKSVESEETVRARATGLGSEWSSSTRGWWDGLLDSERDEVARRWLAWKKAVSPQVVISRRKALMKYCRSIGLPPSGEYDL